MWAAKAVIQDSQELACTAHGEFLLDTAVPQLSETWVKL